MVQIAQEETRRRVRHLLGPRDIRETRMFGTVAFMVDGAMLLAVDRDGGLLARVSPERDAELLERPHTRRSEMGAGRSMGVGWVHVDAEGVATDDGLQEWVDVALERHKSAHPGSDRDG